MKVNNDVYIYRDLVKTNPLTLALIGLFTLLYKREVKAGNNVSNSSVNLVWDDAFKKSNCDLKTCVA